MSVASSGREKVRGVMVVLAVNKWERRGSVDVRRRIWVAPESEMRGSSVVWKVAHMVGPGCEGGLRMGTMVGGKEGVVTGAPASSLRIV